MVNGEHRRVSKARTISCMKNILCHIKLFCISLSLTIINAMARPVLVVLTIIARCPSSIAIRKL